MVRLLAALAGVLLTVGAVSCGDDRARERSSRSLHAVTPDPAHAAEVERNPYAVTCGDLAAQTVNPASARLVIHAEFALARVPELRRRVAVETLNRVGRSVYYAMTALCRGRDEAFRPARAAVDAVRRGRFLAARDRPG